MSLTDVNDDDLRRLLFDKVIEKFDAEQARDRSLTFYNRCPDLFSVQRSDGCILTIDRCDESVLLRCQIIGPPWLVQQPWKFNVARTSDGMRVRMPDQQESIAEIAENIVRTFLDPGIVWKRRSARFRSPTTTVQIVDST